MNHSVPRGIHREVLTLLVLDEISYLVIFHVRDSNLAAYYLVRSKCKDNVLSSETVNLSLELLGKCLYALNNAVTDSLFRCRENYSLVDYRILLTIVYLYDSGNNIRNFNT